MIKIIREGYFHKDIIPHYRIKCDNCHTVFECDKTDTWFETMGHGEGGQYIFCPRCQCGISEYMNQDWITTNLDEIVKENKKEMEIIAGNEKLVRH